MTVAPLIAMALTSLGHHKLRSLLTMLGIVFGVGAVIAMLAISEGARVQAMASINEMGIGNILVKSRQPTVTATANDDKQADNVLSYGLTLREVERLARSVPDVIEAVATREVRQKVFAGARRVESRVIATEPRFASIANLAIADGRFIGDLDMERRQAVAVLGADVARDLFKADDPLGRDVRIADQWLRVVGVLARKRDSGGGGGLGADELNRTIFLPETAARARFGLLSVQSEAGTWQVTRLEVASLILRFAEGTDVPARGELVRRMVAREAERSDVEVVVPLELLEQSRRTQRIFTIVMSSIASISLIVGGIGIMNIMLATVLERTREIGIRRAVGARGRDILVQFLVETVVMSLLGGLVGLALGLGGAVLVSSLAGWPTLVTAWSVILSIGISGAVGVVFGLYPAAKAARMQPVEALRHA